MRILRCSLTSSVNPVIINLFFISLTLFNLSPSLCKIFSDEYEACGIDYNCGDLVNISYPFWGYQWQGICGRPEFELKCRDNKTTTMEIGSLEYNILKINQSDRRMTIARSDLFVDLCPENDIKTATLVDSSFFYTSNDLNISVWYGCPRLYNNSEIEEFVCGLNGTNSERANYFSKEPVPTNSTLNIGGCKMMITVTVTVEGFEKGERNGTAALENALKQGFDVQYGDPWPMACEECMYSGGRGTCGPNSSSQFFCICQDGSRRPYRCPDMWYSALINERVRSRNIIIGIGIVSGGIIISILCIWLLVRRKKHSSDPLHNGDDNMGSTGGLSKVICRQEIENIINKNVTNTPKRYSYLEVKKITKSFKNKLGQGGSSTVYKGILPDGREVAAKLLYESTGNGQDFINEVVSITKTSHVNIVTLLGFCFEGNKRALIYEYMSNGSLDKYIFHRGLLHHNDNHLDRKTLYTIVLGIARGLEYLHRGCNTRILHFDIKPHNILLDNDFCPKISDFGLAKQCKAKESHVSITGAKGTVGFIAPEVVFRSFGRVSHKSDVYSYGMLIFEMLGERKKPNEGRVSQSSEEYFPDWIYKDLTNTEGEIFCEANTTEVEEMIARKMVMVGLHCIQTMPDDRPSMSDVVSMLEGSLDCLQIPPKPTMFTPPMLSQASSSSASE